jgi:hypothetical protein
VPLLPGRSLPFGAVGHDCGEHGLAADSAASALPTVAGGWPGRDRRPVRL